MIDFKLKYEAVIFSDVKDITPTPEVIATLIEQFKGFELIPQTFQEIELPGTAPLNRLRFTSQDEAWSILFGRRRITVDKLPIDIKGSNIGELSDFCSNTMDLFTKIFDKYPRRAKRIALITSCMLEEMSESNFSQIYQNLFKSPSFHTVNQPVEWDWRVVSRVNKEISGLQEALNVITDLKRLSGEVESKTERMPFQRIMLTQDLNTVPDNSDPRFDLSHIGSFYEIVRPLHDELENSILSFINA